ncbi:MAG TPA: hypothetical protein VEX15_18945 [Nocardioidaceae bacterium]|nr:hypothetical protein [Nocardioidaceae bacterium]
MRVEFLIDGDLSDSTLASFPELQVARGAAGGTVLFGDVVDRAHLDGLLARFLSQNIAVVEFRQLPA